MRAHDGFLARGQIHIQYADGCTVEFVDPRSSLSSRGTRSTNVWVVGDETAVLVEFDFDRDTVSRRGIPDPRPHG